MPTVLEDLRTAALFLASYVSRTIILIAVIASCMPTVGLDLG